MLSPNVSPTNAQVGRSKTNAERKVGTMSNYMTRTPARSLSAGQIIRGEVTDLRNREITVTMEDNTIVTGYLQEGANLSIGETAAFLITNIQPDRISLELMQNSLQSSEQITSHKALTEAGLPINEKNLSIVLELLANNMPIHKQSIMNILTQSYQFKDISIPCLVAMNHLGMEITEETAAQFENCLTKETTLEKDVISLAKALVSYLKEQDSPQAAELIKQLLRTLAFPELEETGEEIVSETLQATTQKPLISNGLSNIFGFNRLANLLSGKQVQETQQEIQQNKNTSGMVSSEQKKELSSSLSSFTETQKNILEAMTKPEKLMNPMALYQKPIEISEELKSLLTSLDQFSEKMKEMFSFEELSLRDAITLLQEGRQIADDIDFFQINETRNHFLEKHPEFSELLEKEPDSELCKQLSEQLETTLKQVPSCSTLLPSTLAEQLEHEFSQYLTEKGTIAAILTQEELSELNIQAKNFPFHPQLLERLKDGDVSPKEFLTILRNTASLVNDTALQAMTGTDAFGKLFEQAFLSSFTMTPKELATPGKAEEFYDKAYARLHSISDALSGQASFGNSDSFDLANQKSGNMQKQIEFLKSLNEMFTYLQLPVKLKNKIRTSDLYVYTKKEAMRNNPKQLSVLLHLDMDYLGPLDIHLSLNHATVKSQIYCEDADTKKFLIAQIPSLKTALNLKGYLFEAEVNEREKPFHFVKDFIQKEEKKEVENEKQITSKKRYTFDIRA